jgi:hypothetical protein
MKKEIIKVRKRDASDVTVYKFDNTPEDQKKARELLASGKAPITKRTEGTLTYILPREVPRDLYDIGEFQQKKEDRKWLQNKS